MRYDYSRTKLVMSFYMLIKLTACKLNPPNNNNNNNNKNKNFYY